MGPETGCSSPSGKRSRDPEDEVYVDNLHSHKRYLSEIMASSLNGLTVGESLSENLMDSPARSEGMCYPRDEVCSQYSPMSEDSDDTRYYDTSQHDGLSNPSSPVSPHRYQRPLAGFSSSPPPYSYPSLSCNITDRACSQPRQRGSDSEGRFPSSPSDICHSADLRRAALLRSVQMKAQPPSPPAFESPYNSSEESMPNVEDSEDRTCSYMKPLVDVREFQESTSVQSMLLEERSPMGLSEPEPRDEKCYGVPNFHLKDESGEGVFEANGLERIRVVPSRRSALGGNASKFK